MNTTIYNYFRKSTLISALISLPTLIIPNGIPELYNQVIQVGKIHDTMTISNFLSPTKEEKEEDTDQATLDDILQEVIKEHLGVQAMPEEEEDEQTQP